MGTFMGCAGAVLILKGRRKRVRKDMDAQENKTSRAK